MPSFLKNIIVLLAFFLVSVAANTGPYACEKCCPEIRDGYCCDDDIPGCVCEDSPTLERAFWEEEEDPEQANHNRWYVRHTRRKQNRTDKRKWKREGSVCRKFERKDRKENNKMLRMNKIDRQEDAKNRKEGAKAERIADYENRIEAKEDRAADYEARLAAKEERIEARDARVEAYGAKNGVVF
uniref:Uncharacterized protein n=1 Tax=Ditylum brightwellii TaxID=49249 RepID=A0A7S1ZG45_9STRA|mmetsp:Transcript_31200/g.46525  ORF Transcript_31200/g.46525 Transcript_31200/m.46525 type:complete len:184 (+) Transcript_31200:110-661(+)